MGGRLIVITDKDPEVWLGGFCMRIWSVVGHETSLCVLICDVSFGAGLVVRYLLIGTWLSCDRLQDIRVTNLGSILEFVQPCTQTAAYLVIAFYPVQLLPLYSL